MIAVVDGACQMTGIAGLGLLAVCWAVAEPRIGNRLLAGMALASVLVLGLILGVGRWT